MSTQNPHGHPQDDTPLTAMLISLSGASGAEHETIPPGADRLSVRAGHEPDRFQVRSILYVPMAVVVVLVLAYILVTWLFSEVMNNKAVADARARESNPQAVELIKGCTQYIGTVRQGFGEMSKIAAAELNKVLAGSSVSEPEMYAPVELITRDSLGVECP